MKEEDFFLSYNNSFYFKKKAEKITVDRVYSCLNTVDSFRTCDRGS